MTHPAPIKMLLASFVLATSAACGAAPLRNSFDIRVPQPPTRVTVMGNERLSYEVHLVNFSDRALTVTEWELVNGSPDHALAKLDGDALKSHIALVGESAADANGQIAPGRSAVIYVDVDVPDGASTSTLRNRIRYVTANGNDPTIVSRPMPIAAGAASVISPPLRGGPWVAIHASAWPRGHRRVFYSVAGRGAARPIRDRLGESRRQRPRERRRS